MNNKSNLELRDPAVSEIFGLFLSRHLRTAARMEALAPAEIKRIVRAVDGRGCDIECARAMHADPDSFARYAVARNAMLDGLVENGAVYAQCPHCRNWEADLAPVALAVGLRVPFWPVSDDGVFLALPSLSEPVPRGSRPASPVLSSRLRAVAAARPDSGSAGRSLLFRIDEAAERELGYWREYSHPDLDAPADREQWREDIAGFRAVLRLAAVANHPQSGSPFTPPEVMDFTLGELMFFDNVHHLLHDCPVPGEHGLAVRCALCGETFLPLL